MTQNNEQVNIDFTNLIVTGSSVPTAEQFIQSVKDKEDFYNVNKNKIIIEGLEILRNQFINCLSQESLLDNNDIKNILLYNLEDEQRNDLTTLTNILKTDTNPGEISIFNTFCFENFVQEIFDKPFKNKLKTTEMKALCTKIIEQDIPFVFVYDENLIVSNITKNSRKKEEQDKLDMYYKNIMYKAIAESIKSFFTFSKNMTDPETGITKKQKFLYNKLYILSCSSYVPKSRISMEKSIDGTWDFPTNNWLIENEKIQTINFSVFKSKLKEILEYKISPKQ